MANLSEFVAKDLRQLCLEAGEETNKKKRKKESCSRGATSKRKRAVLLEKNAKMSVESLCSAERGISGFSRIETRSQRQLKVSKEQTQNNTALQRRKSASYTFTNFFIPVVKSVTPLPELDWADPKEVWSNMLQKDRKYCRDPLYFRRQSFIQPKMRAILLDWLTEVCEVYKLHRETYYLAVDFIDRYLSGKDNLAKQRLQLIGTTALFIAAKIEEIYPPKISEFAYVTDGACTESEILDEELLMLKGLNWNLSPITVNSWLNIYLQLSFLAFHKEKPDFNFTIPSYPQQHFVKVAQVLDLCTLDVGYLQFSYSILAASALYHMLSIPVEEVTGHTWDELYPCIQWMKCFVDVIRENGTLSLKSFEQVAREDAHNIQTHAVDLKLLDKAQTLQGARNMSQSETRSGSPLLAMFTGPPTPPSSTKKSLSNVALTIQ